MTFKVNGVDLCPYIAKQGYKWTRNDIDGPNAGRTQGNADMIRDRKAIKIRLDITCRPLTDSEISTVLRAIEPEFVSVVYTDPMEGADVTKVMYSNNVPASFLMKRKDGTEWWNGVTFPLVEK